MGLMSQQWGGLLCQAHCETVFGVSVRMGPSVTLDTQRSMADHHMGIQKKAVAGEVEAGSRLVDCNSTFSALARGRKQQSPDHSLSSNR